MWACGCCAVQARLPQEELPMGPRAAGGKGGERAEPFPGARRGDLHSGESCRQVHAGQL